MLTVAVRCVPEKSVDLTEKLSPIGWLNEEEFFAARAGDHYLVNSSLLLQPFEGVVRADWGIEMPDSVLEPRNPAVFQQHDGHKVVIIGGERIRVKEAYFRRGYGLNQSFVRETFIPFRTYLHMGKIGLLTFEQDVPTQVELPLIYRNNRSAPIAVWDEQMGRFFVFQSGCGPRTESGTCQRTGWWLSKGLRVVQTIALPEGDLLDVEEKMACFSCGCGCYTQESVHAVNGIVYFHISGFPLPASQRGLYEVILTNAGRSEWRQVIEGRIEPPLAFSPSGCEVAFYRISYFGDRIETQNICEG